MVDINNIELNIGDKVVYTHAASGYLFQGEVAKFTKLGIGIRTKINKYVSGKGYIEDYHIINLIGAQQRVMKLG